MEGGSDQIAGRNRVDERGIQHQTFSAGKREKGDTVRSLAIFSLMIICNLQKLILISGYVEMISVKK